MRVTKTIREYIESEVSKRIDHKYAAEREESKRQNDLLNAFLKGAAEAAEEAYAAYCAEHFPTIEDFCELHLNDEYNRPHFYSSRTATLRDRQYINSIHSYGRRKESEVQRIVKDIVVTLELGGTRKELDEMLANL